MNLVEYGITQGIEQGIKQGRKQGIEQGREQGVVQGENKKLIQMVSRKLRKRKNPKQIAEELEEEETVIERICKAIQTCGTSADWEQIYRVWKQ